MTYLDTNLVKSQKVRLKKPFQKANIFKGKQKSKTCQNRQVLIHRSIYLLLARKTTILQTQCNQCKYWIISPASAT